MKDGQPVHKADLTAICELIVYQMWESHCLTTQWVSMTCYRVSFAFLCQEILVACLWSKKRIRLQEVLTE
jgi:hypothetical protein